MITPHVLREALRSLSQARTRSSEQEPSGLLNPRPQGQGEPGTGRVAVRRFPTSGRLWLSVSRHLLGPLLSEKHKPETALQEGRGQP